MKSKQTVLLAISLLVTAGRSGLAAEPIPLDRAVREGKVAVYVSALGGSTGNVVSVNVKRLVGTEVRVNVTPGTIFRPKADAQRMAAARIKGIFVDGAWQPAEVMVLADDQAHDYLLEAYCVDYNKRAPQHGEEFLLETAAKESQRVKKLLDLAVKVGTPLADVQVAIWMDREKSKGVAIDERELQSRFSAANEQSIESARRLLVQVGPDRDALPPGKAGRSRKVPGVDVQVDKKDGKVAVGVDALGYKVNVDAPIPPRLRKAVSGEAEKSDSTKKPPGRLKGLRARRQAESSEKKDNPTP